MTGGRRVFLRRAAGLGLAALCARRVAAAAGAGKPLILSPVAPGIYTGAVERDDLPLSPCLVAIGQDGVLVVDPGPNLNHGRRLVAAIRRRTALPVRWVVNSHPHPWQVLANAAFAELRPRPAFLASTATADAMRSRCDACRRLLVAELGPAAMAGTGIVLPRPALRDGIPLEAAGLRWQVRLFANAHSTSDTALYAPSLQLLYGGGLVTGDQVPDLRDGSLTGWRAALRALAALPATAVIGDAVGPPQRSLAPTLAYLDGLEDAIRQGLARGVDAADASRAVPGDAFRQWRGFVPRHALNVQRAWLELEDQWMRTAPAGPS
ncbi:MBL fold metallo-hydrolase [Cupriavidus sp. UGS-1]|uniref:MBL fold metallo-hydrolase n=1 Tax=Cupriavidus sp. UGS-1 TaxID=2899826 RepID=UPI001E4DCC60|nr:MBL fold metallo-hydrolase [Cupriavidus sp. UGS-1]